MAITTGQFDIRALSLLSERLDAIIQNKALSVVQGGVLGKTTDETAQGYADAIGYVRAMNDVIKVCEDIEDQIMGRKTK